MPDTDKTQDQKDPRTLQIEARKKRMKELKQSLPRVRVNPVSDEMRRALVHPNGRKFPEGGSVEWPLDQFTRRRIKDGSVTREDEHDDKSGDDKKPRRASTPSAQPTEPGR